MAGTRSIFAKSEVSSNITGIDKTLVERFCVILKTLNSPYKINTIKFAGYAKETAAHYIEKYRWYPRHQQPTKFLDGKDIIENFLLPIGTLGENA